MPRYLAPLALLALALIAVSPAVAQQRARPGGGGGGGGGGGETPPPDPALVYADNGIHVMNADGTNARRLVSLRRGEVARAPCWSPDSTEVAFCGRLAGQPGIFAAPVAGGSTRRITHLAEPSGSFAAPDWSFSPAADGHHKIAFADTGVDPGNWDIYVVNSDGTGRINLTATADRDESYPAWSPDGVHLVFRRDSDLVLAEVGLVDGSPAIIRETTVLATNYTATFACPRWANVGDQVVFSLLVDGRLRIVTLDLADPLSTPALVTDSTAGDERWASYSPDDSRLAFHRSGNGGGIFVINSDGTGEVRISSRGSDPNWRRTP